MTIIQRDNFGYEDSFRCRFHSGCYNYPLHMHQHMETAIVLGGEIEIITENGIETAREGDIALIPSFTAHGFRTPKRCEIWISVFSAGFLDGFGEPSLTGSGAVFHAEREVFEYLKKKLVFSESKTPISIRASLFAILEEYFAKRPSCVKSKKPSILPTLFSYLEAHYREEITLGTVAAAIGYSESYISHALAAIPEMNFSSLLSGIRIEEAKRLIAKAELPISEIALECGFGCERSFHRAFRRLVGMTPCEWRNYHKQVVLA